MKLKFNSRAAVVSSIILSIFPISFLFTNCSQNQSQAGLSSSTQVKSQRNNFGSSSSTSRSARLNSFGGVNVQYFGYWGLGMNGLNGSLTSASNYSNIAFIRDDNFEAIENKIKQAESLDLKPVLMVQNLLFPWHEYKMHSDWKNRWDQFQNLIVNKYPSILGFYIFDEPFHNFNIHYNAADKAAAATRFHGQLTELSNYIKSRNQGRIIATTFAYVEVKPYIAKLGIPSAIDWIGVNCYYDFGADCSETEIVNYYNILKNVKGPNQKFMLTLDAYLSQNVCNISEEKQRNVVKRIDFTLAWAQANIPVAALTPFLYQEDHNGEQLCGASTMPLVENRLQTIAQTIVYKSTNLSGSTGSTSPSTQPITTKNICSGNDMLTINDKNNVEISRVTQHQACMPKCEGNDYVRRNEKGIEVDRWKNAPDCIQVEPPVIPPPVQSPTLKTKDICSGDDMVTINEINNTEVSRVGKHVACTPKCEGNDYVRRNEASVEVDRWKNAPNCVSTQASVATPPVAVTPPVAPVTPPTVVVTPPPVLAPPVAEPPPVVIPPVAPVAPPPAAVVPPSTPTNPPNIILLPVTVAGTFTIHLPIVLPVVLREICSGDDMVTQSASSNTEISRVQRHYKCIPKCEANDYVRRNENGVEVDRWVNAPSCITAPPPPVIVTRVTKEICQSDDMVTIDVTSGQEVSRITGHATCKPKCESNDSVRRNENGIEIDRWVSAPHCLPKCEGPNLVRRNELNIVVDTWFNAPMCK